MRVIIAAVIAAAGFWVWDSQYNNGALIRAMSAMLRHVRAAFGV